MSMLLMFYILFIVMKILNRIFLVLLVVWGLNWALVWLFSFDLVAFILWDMSIWSRIVYILVGIWSVWTLILNIKK